MAPSKSDLLQGTLDVLVLKTLSAGPMHGWGISQRIQQLSEEVLEVNQGSLYPALHRLETDGALEATWRTGESGPRRRYYRLTRAGHAALAQAEREWSAFSGGVAQVALGGDHGG